MDESEIKALLTSTLDELFIAMGKELTLHDALPKPPAALLRLAKAWWVTSLPQIKKIICNSEAQQLLQRTTIHGDTGVALVIAIADMVSHISLGVSPWIVAALVVKIGVTSFCRDGQPEL